MCFVNINILIIKYLYYLGVGKCFAKGTKVLMYDGTHQNVENLIVGNQIMGDDSTSRIIQSTTKGEGVM